MSHRPKGACLLSVMAAKFVLPSCNNMFSSWIFSSKLSYISKSLLANSRKNRFSSNFSRSFSETIERIKELLAAKSSNDELRSKTARLFVGTGQYYEHETDERVIILSLGDDENTRPPFMLHDTALHRDEVVKLEHELNSLPLIGSLHSGELDSVQDSPWKYGFVHKPSFSIFSASGFCCQLRQSNSEGRYFRIFDEHVHEDIPLSDIEHIQVSLSPEPWEERKLQLKMKNGDVVTIIEDHEENMYNDDGLASLMLTTEWMVKAAGHLCLTARQFGDTKVSLKLPSVLRADVNPWIAMRNKIWADKSNAK